VNLKDLGSLGICNKKLNDVVQTLRLLLKNENTKKHESPSTLRSIPVKDFMIQFDSVEKQYLATKASLEFFNKGKFQKAIKQLGIIFILLFFLFFYFHFFIFFLV
jgi:hypothetical protein